MSRFFKKLEKLQSKSDSAKHRIAFVSALVLTVLVLSIWISTLGYSAAPEEEKMSPTQVLGINIKNQWDTVVKGFKKVID